jgi:tetratricopeptide (TPR) repeat protein
VDYPATFSQPVPYTTEELAGIVGQPRFNRNAPDGQPWSGAYGWEKFENAAALAQHVRAPDWQVGQWWLQAAWAVRLDLIPGEADFAVELAGAVRGLPTTRGSAADLHTPRAVQIARDWGEMIEAGEVENTSAALAVAWLYRSRGELQAANDWLRKAVAKDPALADSALLQYLANSIGLEHEYLGRAREALIKSYDSRELRDNQRGAAAFLLGELSRRLGDVGGAKFWYDEAQGKALGLVRPDLLKQQRDIVTLGKLY